METTKPVQTTNVIVDELDHIKKSKQEEIEQMSVKIINDERPEGPARKHHPNNHKKRTLTTKSKRKAIKKSRRNNRR